MDAQPVSIGCVRPSMAARQRYQRRVVGAAKQLHGHRAWWRRLLMEAVMEAAVMAAAEKEVAVKVGRLKSSMPNARHRRG